MKELTIKIDDVNAKIVMDILKYHSIPSLKIAQEKDKFKDNGYLINACEKLVTAIETASEEK